MEPESPPESPVEMDERFPSGPWTGFFLEPARQGRQWMELRLTFREGVLHGEGRDYVGPFLLVGRYETSSGKCWWAKRYVGKHDVAYQGYNEGKGIWGTWTIDVPPLRGGFHIWPEGMPDPSRPTLKAEADVPIEAEPVETAVAEPVGAD